jgi:galactokinase
MAQEGNMISDGFDMWVYGNIPNGSGLSSSASLEVVTGYALGKMFDIPMTNDHIALIGQKAENGYVGMNCGIMDQFAVAMGKKGCAIYLNTATLDYQYAPLSLDGLDILIMDTRKKRGLKDSKYNDRVKECTTALEVLRRYGNAPTLCEADEELLEKAKADMSEDIYRRARHAITEDIRTQRAVDALEENDIVQFGQLMNASHVSLETDYEVTGKELDSLVHNAWECDGVIGARMTGAGFGGCAVALVRSECTEAIKAHVAENYERETGLSAAFYIASVGDGPSEVIDK